MTHPLNVLPVCAIDCNTWILIFIKVHILIFKVLLWLLKTKHNYVYSTKNILPTDSFLSNAEYEVSSFFFFFFFNNISQKQKQKGHNIQLYRNAK